MEALADYAEWRDLRQDPAKYQEAKQLAQETAIRRAEKAFPQIKGKVEVADVATPVTFERYTGAAKGASRAGSPPRK